MRIKTSSADPKVLYDRSYLLVRACNLWHAFIRIAQQAPSPVQERLRQLNFHVISSGPSLEEHLMRLSYLMVERAFPMEMAKGQLQATKYQPVYSQMLPAAHCLAMATSISPAYTNSATRWSCTGAGRRWVMSTSSTESYASCHSAVTVASQLDSCICCSTYGGSWFSRLGPSSVAIRSDEFARQNARSLTVFHLAVGFIVSS